MMSSQPVDPEREYRLIEQLELRIAGASTDEKFENIIQKFLPALLLKLGSSTPRNRNLTMKVCQHVLQRLKIDTSISLPVQALVKTFKDTDSVLVKQFTLVFIEQGLSRVQSQNSSELLPDLLRYAIPEDENQDVSDKRLFSITFEFLLKALQHWKLPDHNTKEDVAMKETFNLTVNQCTILSDNVVHFLLYDAKDATSSDDVGDEMITVFGRQHKMRQHIVSPIAKFLSLSIFTDQQRLIPATILSVDANATASTIADTIFKQHNFDLESEVSVNALFALFDRSKTKLQTRILALLSRSSQSTQHAEIILKIVEKQLFNENVGLEATKLRAAVFTYLTWAVRVSKNLEKVSMSLQAALKHFIELQGWPNMHEQSHSNIDLRAKAYESIGLLSSVSSQDMPEGSIASIDLITWLFTSLRCDMSRDMKGSVDEALSRVLGCTSISNKEDRQNLKKLLLWNITANEGDEDPTYFFATRNSTRYMAIRFANKILPFSDPDARYMNLLALAIDDRREVAEEAGRGLDPYWFASTAKMSTTNGGSTTVQFPTFVSFVQRIIEDSSFFEQPQTGIVALSAMVKFGRNLLATEALSGTSLDVRSESEWASQIDALIHSDASARQMIKDYMKDSDQSILATFLTYSIKGISLGSSDCALIALELLGLAPNDTILKLDPEILSWCRIGIENATVQLQASRVLGIAGSLSEFGIQLADDALAGSSNWQAAVGQESVVIRGRLLTASFITTRFALRRAGHAESDATLRLLDFLASVVEKSRDKALIHAAYAAIGQICICTSSQNIPVEKLNQLATNLVDDAKKESEVAVTALGRVLNILTTIQPKESLEPLLQRLYGLHEIRRAEFHFAVGEAMAVAALGFRSSSTLTEFDVQAPASDWGSHPDLFDTFLSRCLADSATTKPSLKKAAAIWLLCLIQYCPNAKLLQPRLQDCQAAFARLLTDRDEIVQETGSRGLGLVYEKGDRNLRDDLVRNLVQSFTGGGVKMSGTVSEDTELFESGALPTENGQSVTTYKDIVSLATEMGDPSLVYRFMNLASNNAIWTSRAAFGRFGLGGLLADSSYLTENKKFYPKLFRYRFDPNPNVQRAMEDIWKALVKDPNRVIEDNFDLIMDDLLISVVSGKEWRAREASCGAIADLIQGREVEKFEKYLNDIWKVAFKVLDDVKETVRVAAMRLCRTLTSMLVRNLEVGHGSTKRATTMLGHAVPFLLQQMEGGTAQEVQQYAVVTLLEVIKKAPPKSLLTFAPVMLETLVLSLSSLEHESINYLHLNADKYGLTAEKLDKMRVSSINASPVSDAIERCLDSLASDTDVSGDNTVETSSVAQPKSAAVQDAMQRLEKAFKSAIGLPSKVGLSRVMVTLVVRHQTMIRPYADRFVRLTRKNILDRNATISVSFSMALAYLVRVASEKEVLDTNNYAQKLYFESQELSHRAVAGEIMQAISKASNDVFMRFASTFLPFAFIGRNDLDKEVQARFDPAWKDNVGGSRALNLYLSEIVGLVNAHIESNLWPVRQACCLAVADLVRSMDTTGQYTQSEAETLWPVMQQALSGKTWAGKENVISAYPTFVKKASVLWPSHDAQIKSIAFREAKRKNAAYRVHAIEALGELASCRPDLDLSDEGLALLTSVAEELEEEVDAMDVDGDEISQARLADGARIALSKSLFQILSTGAKATVLDPALDLVTKIRKAHSTMVDAEIYDGARRFITQASKDVSGLGGGADNGQARGEQHDLLEAFSQRLVAATFLHDRARHSSDHEKVRRSRVELAAVLSKSGFLNPVTRNELVQVLKGWLYGERVLALKQDMEKTITTLETH